MSKRCQVTGKKPCKGRKYVTRGIAKKKKGIGLNITGISKRRFQPNLFKKRFWFAEENRFITLRLSAAADENNRQKRSRSRRCANACCWGACLTLLTISLVRIPFPSENAPVKIFFDRRVQFKHLYIKAIQNAKQSIAIRTYTLSDPSVIAALTEAQSRGVAISIETDKSSPPLADLPWRHPPCKGLMHEKIAIFDDHLTILATANLTEGSLVSDENRLIVVDSKELVKHLKNEASPFTINVGTYEITGYRLPTPGALEKIGNLLDSATTSIDISMYTFTEKSLIEKIVTAYKRGISTNITLDRNSYPATKRFTEEEIPFTLSPSTPLMHCKCATLDNKIFIIGSANWTKSAFNKNKDYYLIIKNRI